MGMSRSYVMEITTVVVRVLSETAPSVVSFPRAQRDWKAVEAGSASRHGYPGVVGAVDVSLIEIERPEKFDGFYCSKCYPALNVQTSVSVDNLFLSVEVRPGSWPGRKCWLHSYSARRALHW
ncbi:hypothetical protein JG688_00018237 [Phytophthora aleatoria]|uniref:Uncharacterized protein n=1 Tax=Phytophthora aleatoria TaxID=2496075 RepID=A0A8J5LY24_9STRA|nr:hypothetical protein JG688_00018237 [Phytophthora aleatoria]